MIPYFIAAPPRSGTSLIANLLHKHGVWIGDTGQELADEHNPYGYFENKQIVDITKQIFWDNGLKARSDVPFFFSRNILRRYDPKSLRNKVLKIVKDNNPWLYKDSKLLHVYPLFKAAFPEATWILPQRNSSSIMDSLKRHKVWKERAHRLQDSDATLMNMIIRSHDRQYEICKDKVDSVLVDVNKLVFDEDYAKQFIQSCGLKFDSGVYYNTVDRNIWSRT